MPPTGYLLGLTRRPLSRAAAVALGGWIVTAALGQVSASSWWPKFQHDAQNSGAVPVMGIVQQVHISWSVRISDPIDPSSEYYSSPVFSADNTRLYVGGRDSALTAVELASHQIAWTLTLGDGTGIIHQTPTVADDGAIYVGSWDAAAPFDGFCKVVDDGGSARIAWTYPMQRVLASAAITPDGLIVICGKHETLDWGVFGLRDLGDAVEQVWTVATGPQGGTPAVSADGRWVYVGSDTDRKEFVDPIFWQIDTSDGTVQQSIVLDAYVWAASPTITQDGHIFIGEGMTFGDPDPLTEGKLYVFNHGLENRIEQLCALPLNAGHLNGGIGAIRTTPAGLTRLYVPANGFGAAGANLITLEFDPDAICDDPDQPMLRKVWTHSLGLKASTYPAAVVTRDAVIYTAGPADYTLHAIRDAGETAKPLWTLSLPDFSRVDGWQPSNQRGHKEIVPGPDGVLYWMALDGYLYAVNGWLTGDLTGDGKVDASDLTWLKRLVSPLVLGPILRPLAKYELLFPEIDANTIGDIDGNGALEDADVNLLESFLSAP